MSTLKYLEKLIEILNSRKIIHMKYTNVLKSDFLKIFMKKKRCIIKHSINFE